MLLLVKIRDMDGGTKYNLYHIRKEIFCDIVNLISSKSYGNECCIDEICEHSRDYVGVYILSSTSYPDYMRDRYSLWVDDYKTVDIYYDYKYFNIRDFYKF